MSADSGHSAEKDAGTIETGKAGVSDAETLAAEPGQSVVEPADRVRHPGTSLLPPAEQGAGDYTACGDRMIAANLGAGGGTARVAVYCDRLVNHDGNHHADVEWDGLGRAAQGDARRHLATRVTSPGGGREPGPSR